MVINGSGDTYIGPGGIGATSILIDNTTSTVTIGASSFTNYKVFGTNTDVKLAVVGFATFTQNVYFGQDWVITGGGDGIFGLYYTSPLDPVPGGVKQWGYVRATGAGTTALVLSCPGYAGAPETTGRIEVTPTVTNVLGALSVSGALSKGSGSFRIAHPILEGKDLVHSFIEGPRADLIYRGTVTLAGGTATVNLDSEYGLAPGTWNALCRNPQVWVTSDTGWTQCRGSVSNGVLTINAKTSTCTETVSWLVVAERQDAHMYNTDWTDENSFLRFHFQPQVILETSERAFYDYFIRQDIKIDYLHIDGDHSYEGFKKDFELYSTIMSENGIITIHDVDQKYHDTFVVTENAKQDFVPFDGPAKYIKELEKNNDWNLVNLKNFSMFDKKPTSTGLAILTRK